MSDIVIERLEVRLRAVDPSVAAEAAKGLDEEIRRAIGSLRVADLPSVDTDLAGGTVSVDAQIDAASLRGIIARFISDMLTGRDRAGEGVD